MQFTVRCHVNHDPRLDDVSRIFQSMARTAYNSLLQGRGRRDVEFTLLERYGVKNLLWRRNAIIQANITIESQRQLLPLYAAELEWKIQRVKAKLSQTSNPLKKNGYGARVRKLERRREEFEARIEKGRPPNIVFGGRRHVGSAKWRLKRRGQFLSVGDGWKKGNLNTRIHKNGEGEYALEVRNWRESESFTVPLNVPSTYRRVLEAIAEGKLLPLHPLKTGKGRRPYTVRLVRHAKGYGCHVSFEVPEKPIHGWAGERLAAIDVNPTHIDMAILNKDGNLVAAKSFKEPSLIYARKNKRLWLASNLTEKALKWIRFFNTNAVAIEEELKFRGVEHGKAANRIIANFMHRKLLELIAIKALKDELILVRLPAAYSSRIAAAKYKPTYPRMSVHQLAALVLGRRALGCSERLDTAQLKAVAGPVRKRQAWVKAIYLHGHRHPYLKPRISADGRIDVQDAKGKGAFDKWVTPRTRYAAKEALMQRLSYLMPARHRVRRVEATRYDGWTRAHGGNAPPPQMTAST